MGDNRSRSRNWTHRLFEIIRHASHAYLHFRKNLLVSDTHLSPRPDNERHKDTPKEYVPVVIKKVRKELLQCQTY